MKQSKAALVLMDGQVCRLLCGLHGLSCDRSLVLLLKPLHVDSLLAPGGLIMDSSSLGLGGFCQALGG